jgi:hypothetical protein
MAQEFSLTYIKISGFIEFVECIGFVEFDKEPNFVTSMTLCPSLKGTRTANEPIMLNNLNALQIFNS